MVEGTAHYVAGVISDCGSFRTLGRRSGQQKVDVIHRQFVIGVRTEQADVKGSFGYDISQTTSVGMFEIQCRSFCAAY